MSQFVRRWSSDDIEKLKSMAGKYSRQKIAAELERGPTAVAVKAHQLRISLRLGLPEQTTETPEPTARR